MSALLEIQHLHKRFGRRVVLEDVTLSFEEGSTTGIVGPNGAGKSTCLNVLTGLHKPDRGRVLLEGTDIAGLSPHKIAARGLARSFQLMNLFDDFTALENVLLATPAFRAGRFDFFRRARPHVERPLEVLNQIGLSHRANEKAKLLAYGERRALEIGVALAAQPRVMFLDEPTAGLGTEATEQLRLLIQKLKRKLTLVIVEHDLQFLHSLADKIAVIHWGQVIAQGTPDELRDFRWSGNA